MVPFPRTRAAPHPAGGSGSPGRDTAALSVCIWIDQRLGLGAYQPRLASTQRGKLGLLESTGRVGPGREEDDFVVGRRGHEPEARLLCIAAFVTTQRYQ